ncbi:hypothetical protein [Verrucomicrobium spinosum]|uniref:hypothetical protein n=1 Tax=Verrucomicrobium spinosum TaxID=2736 RepID=UPI000B1ABEBB|nr:hypothetical protein [Verrucomicrobium spinosum]
MPSSGLLGCLHAVAHGAPGIDRGLLSRQSAFVHAAPMNPPEAKPRTPGFGFGRVRQAISRFASSEEGGRAKRLFALLIVSMLVLNALNVVNSYVGRDFITSVESRNMPRFMSVSLLYVLVFAACTLVAVFYRFFEERLGILWRDWQTREFLGRYLDKRTYLRLAAAGGVDNPDQRIAEDVRAFAATSLSFFLMSVNAAFTVIAFSGVMWSISPSCSPERWAMPAGVCGDDPAGAAARGAELCAVRPGGDLPRGADPCAGQWGGHGHAAP